MKDVLFTIITVCFNSEKTIEKALKSVLEQTEGDYEYLIIDGGSTDSTMEIVKSYAPKFGGRIKWVSEKDHGIYDAMNKGIRMARGKLIGMVNSDDYYEPDALENMKRAYEKLPESDRKHVILYGMQRRLRGGEEIEIEFVNHRILGEGMICHPTCFVSGAVYDEFGAYDTRYKSAADLDFLLRIKKNTDTVFVPVYHVISNFELGGMSSSSRGAKEAARIRYKYGVFSKVRMYYVIIQSDIISFVHNLKRRKRK